MSEDVNRLRQEHGFTLVELLAVMLIGGIVLAGVASLMQVVLRQSTRDHRPYGCEPAWAA